VLEHRQAP